MTAPSDWRLKPVAHSSSGPSQPTICSHDFAGTARK